MKKKSAKYEIITYDGLKVLEWPNHLISRITFEVFKFDSLEATHFVDFAR